MKIGTLKEFVVMEPQRIFGDNITVNSPWLKLATEVR